MRKRYIALVLAFATWIAVSAGSTAHEAKTMPDRAAKQLAIFGE